MPASDRTEHDPRATGTPDHGARAAGEGYRALHEVVTRLRRECPWDRQQTHHSLVPYLIEESYEVVDAIADLNEAQPGSGRAPVGGDAGTDRSDDGSSEDAALVEELGDLLFQVEFHAAIAEEQGRFTIADVTTGIHDKLVRRHPHVFGDVDVADSAEVVANWDAIKRAEKPERTSVFDGIAASLPALSLAREVQHKAAKASLEIPDDAATAATVTERLAGLAATEADTTSPDAEVGDLLFAVVALARRLDVDPESALRAATNRFRRRVDTRQDD